MKLTSLKYALTAALLMSTSPVAFADQPKEASSLTHYANIALAKYEDSLITAKALDAAIDAFLAAPTATTLATCLLYTSPSPRDRTRSRMPSSA